MVSVAISHTAAGLKRSAGTIELINTTDQGAISEAIQEVPQAMNMKAALARRSAPWLWKRPWPVTWALASKWTLALEAVLALETVPANEMGPGPGNY